MDENVKQANWPLGILGAVLGGVAGYFVFLWIAQQGFYALILPGAAAGLGCATMSKGQSRPLGIVCALLAVPLGLFSEWQFAPFVVDESLGYFLTHLHERQPITLILIAVGVWLAYWLGVGSTRPTNDRPDAKSQREDHE
jgi:hypothetical protein